ncbi:hypothetical protein QWZ08_05725 [Ferruginibacter paludis]|uniref:hypothetical protein n=1 Tax=Ferruginibacter paludis TaxID=1310417 RepID=UPI0025B4681F|nr:hypothetical protein [Ferruginibacter paludis]MDN3655113.1 hypothetical protein [Ferruginibacter paludis]
MNEDLIGHNFAEAVDKGTIKKVINVIKIILLLCIVYSFSDVWKWYAYLSAVHSGNHTFKYFYKLILLPAAIIVNLVARITSLILNLNGTELLYASFVNDEAILLNKGYKLLYKSVLISVITFAIEIFIWSVGFVLKI